jgi:hypothetical protein
MPPLETEDTAENDMEKVDWTRTKVVDDEWCFCKVTITC